MRALLLGTIALSLLGAGVYVLQPDPQFGGPLTKQEIMADIERAAETYYQLHGEYPQVPENSTKLGKRLPAGWTVNNYVGPDGKGFALIYEDDTRIESYGYGPEGPLSHLTYTLLKEQLIASTTP